LLVGCAEQTLTKIQALEDSNGVAVRMALVSDFDDPAEDYLDLLDNLGIRHFLQPVTERVTLSGEVGVHKPDPLIFRTALDKIQPGVPFARATFAMENLQHVQAARTLGMHSIHFRGPRPASGQAVTLSDLIPLLEDFVKA
jgi:FMN phosphatase YigB (HAD superfamily)